MNGSSGNWNIRTTVPPAILWTIPNIFFERGLMPRVSSSCSFWSLGSLLLQNQRMRSICSLALSSLIGHLNDLVQTGCIQSVWTETWMFQFEGLKVVSYFVANYSSLNLVIVFFLWGNLSSFFWPSQIPSWFPSLLDWLLGCSEQADPVSVVRVSSLAISTWTEWDNRWNQSVRLIQLWQDSSSSIHSQLRAPLLILLINKW